MHQPKTTESPNGSPHPIGGPAASLTPQAAALPSGGLAAHRAKLARAKTLCRVTRIKTDHIAGRMAHAIIGELMHSGIATEMHLRRGGLTFFEVSQHRAEALHIARSHKPELFANLFDMVA